MKAGNNVDNVLASCVGADDDSPDAGAGLLVINFFRVENASTLASSTSGCSAGLSRKENIFLSSAVQVNTLLLPPNFLISSILRRSCWIFWYLLPLNI